MCKALEEWYLAGTEPLHCWKHVLWVRSRTDKEDGQMCRIEAKLHNSLCAFVLGSEKKTYIESVLVNVTRSMRLTAHRRRSGSRIHAR